MELRGGNEMKELKSCQTGHIWSGQFTGDDWSEKTRELSGSERRRKVQVVLSLSHVQLGLATATGESDSQIAGRWQGERELVPLNLPSQYCDD